MLGHCEICKAEFFAEKPNRRFCGLSCRCRAHYLKRKGIGKHVEELKQCKRCNAPFSTHKRNKEYCGARCQGRFALILSAACEFCGTGYIKTHASRKYCSNKCRKSQSRRKAK